MGDLHVDSAEPGLNGEFGGVDGFPIVLGTQDTEEIIATIKAIAPTFGAINLEDFSAPRCFAIENALQDIGIPVMHDDQHGTAVVVLAGLINAAKVTNRSMNELRVVVNGAGAAGTAITVMLQEFAPGIEIISVDSRGIISHARTDLNDEKKALLAHTNPHNVEGSLADALENSHVFIGVSVAGALTPEMIAGMAPDPIIFAMANPVPEIFPDIAKEAGAAIVATGRSDFPNQVNNALCFPYLFRGALDAKAKQITEAMQIAAARALAELAREPVPQVVLDAYNLKELKFGKEYFIPKPFDPRLLERVAPAVAKAAVGS